MEHGHCRGLVRNRTIRLGDLARTSFAFSFADGVLSGPGWEVVKREAANRQFVLLGEGHDDKLTPIFAEALYRSLQQTHGFDRVALEQDPVAMELACAPERKGKATAVADLAKRYQDDVRVRLRSGPHFIANACALGRGPNPVWGLEQALGSERYLEELEGMAANPAVKALV